MSNNGGTVCNFVLPDIQPIFESESGCAYNAFYRETIHYILHEILSDPAITSLTGSNLELEDLQHIFHAFLPFTTLRKNRALPGEMSFFFLSKYRANAFKFFFEIISNWLVPDKRLNVSLIYAVDFRMMDLSDEIFTLCEIKIHIESQFEVDQILRNLPLLETELRLGIESGRYARRILEIKGLSTDEKTAIIQEDLAYLINYSPKEFDSDVLAEMQHVLVMCREEFKIARACRHLSRIIALHYLYRKWLREAVKTAPHRRHLNLKLFRACLNSSIGSRKVLAIVVGVNFFRDKEIFDKAHLLKAIQNYIPKVQDVESSFFANRRGSELICTLYLEVEKSDEKDFTYDEIQLLRARLPGDLKDCVECVMHPVFMPRNEEEIFRNILSLSNQIKYVRDIPQVFISFDEQTYTHLFYTVILVRVLKPDTLSIQEMFKNAHPSLKYIQDRCQVAGNLRGRYKKEATVFRIKLSKDQFLRFDHSIDLNKARQTVASELDRVIGEFRDFNGGIISKQNELLCEVKELLSNTSKFNDHFLDNFFYSLTPIIMRTLLEPEAVSTLFLMLLESIEQSKVDGKGCLKIEQKNNFVFAMVKAEDPLLKEEIARALAKFQLHSSELAASSVSVYDIIYLGYIYRTDEKEKQQNFSQALQTATGCLC
ncbi:MAG: hypothetical protein H0X29_01640 [Parachlamydiaceae bacterium]|nr:hypothetical protein [Parachlamydiaceae bacterium]